MKKTVKFSQVKLNQKIWHHGEELVKYKKDRARRPGFYGCGKWFGGDENVEIEVVETRPTQSNPTGAEPATEKQLNYLSILGVNVDRPLSKQMASMLISSVKNGEGCGWAGLFFYDGSN